MTEPIESEEVYFENIGLFTVKIRESPEENNGTANVVVEIIQNENSTYIVFDIDDLTEILPCLARVVSFSNSRYVSDEPQNLPY